MGSVASPWTARRQDSRGGLPAYGNQRTTWDEGCRHDYEDPEHPWPGRAAHTANDVIRCVEP